MDSAHAQFQDTHWSVILTARTDRSPAAQESLDTLCRTYWYPLYAHVRRRGRDHHAAQDLAQEFFARLLEKDWLDAVAPEKGRFRTFLLVAMDHLLANDWRDARAAKRGGGQISLSLDEIESGAERFAQDPSDGVIERSFDDAWATAVMDRALVLLQEEFNARGRTLQFEDWKQFLARPATAADCAASARRLGCSAGAVGVAIHRMRERYGELLRATVAHTVADPADVDDELRHLFKLLNA